MSLKARIGLKLLLNLRPLRDRREDTAGRCSICGWEGRFVTNSWILPSDVRRDLGRFHLIRAFVLRESLFCRACCSSLRIRRLADVLLRHYAEQATTLAELVWEPAFRELRIAEINRLQRIHPYLESHPRLIYSEYQPGQPVGEEVDGIRNEDLCRLTYPDQEFDLVLTSETLEHVHDPGRALRETRRILKPGGRHIFTVPVVPSRARTSPRVSVTGDGRRIHSQRPLYHGRGSGPFAFLSRRQDLLTYTDFGMDITLQLGAAGFEPEVHFFDATNPDSDAGLVFCAAAV